MSLFVWGRNIVDKGCIVAGHIQCIYKASLGEWSQPEFVESPFLSVHGLASGLHYGESVVNGRVETLNLPTCG